MIKKLAEHETETYVKTLCFEFFQNINYHPEAKEIEDSMDEHYDFMEMLHLLSRESNMDSKMYNYFREETKPYM